MLSMVSKRTAETRATAPVSGCRDRDRDEGMDMEAFEFHVCLHAQNMTYLHIPYMYIHQISQHAADRNVHLQFVEQKLLFVSGFLQANSWNIQTSLGFNGRQWKGAQEKEAEEKGR